MGIEFSFCLFLTLQKYTTMGKFLKAGKIVILLQGRYAGKKAVIIKNSSSEKKSSGDKKRNFAYCLVAGIQKCPRRVRRKMSETQIAKRQKIRPFVKIVNQTHLMPTRYNFTTSLKLKDETLELAKEIVKMDILKQNNLKEKVEMRKKVKRFFEEKYKAGLKKQEEFMYEPLRF